MYTATGDATSVRIGASRLFRPWRAGLILGALALPAGGVAFAPANPALAADAELSALMRAMAAIKLAFAIPIVVISWIRLGGPISAAAASAYVSVSALAATALALVFSLASIGFASVCFHTALIGFVIAASRDQRFVEGTFGRTRLLRRLNPDARRK